MRAEIIKITNNKMSINHRISDIPEKAIISDPKGNINTVVNIPKEEIEK